MSFSTWKKEFYPVKAETIAKKGSEVDIVQHSLTKWIGLRPKNLAKHGMKRVEFDLISEVDANFDEWPYCDKNSLSITDETCSLCQRYQYEEEDSDNSCETCPLYIVRKNTPCTSCEKDKERISPYSMFTVKGDPEPMIADLRRALRRAKRRVKKEKPQV